MSVYRVDCQVTVESFVGYTHVIYLGSVVQIRVLNTSHTGKVTQAKIWIFPKSPGENDNVRQAAIAATMEERTSTVGAVARWAADNINILVIDGENLSKLLEDDVMEELDGGLLLRFGKIAEKSLQGMVTQGITPTPSQKPKDPTSEDEEKRRQIAFFFGKRWTSGVR